MKLDKLKEVSSAVDYLDEMGYSQNSRLGGSKELLAQSFEFGMSQIPYRIGINRRLGWVEGLQVISGYFDERHLNQVSKSLQHQYGLVHGYGLRIAPQIESVINQLKFNRTTRRAMLHIGQPLDNGEKEKPCMQSAQFIIRDGTLHTIVYARSWDMIIGLPYDVMTFNMLSQTICSIVNASPGSTHFNVGSAHYYQKDLDRIESSYGFKKFRRLSPFSLNDFIVAPQHATWDEARNWAFDQLNSIDEWKNNVPGGVILL